MNSEKLKRIVLILLVLIAGYIWIRNLSFYQSGNSSLTTDMQKDTSLVRPDRKKTATAYHPPRVNPFKRADVQAASANRGQPQLPKTSVIPEKPSTRLTLTGLIGRPPLSQGIFQDRAGATLIKGLGDSTDIWQLILISSDKAIFSSGKYRDTLLLKK